MKKSLLALAFTAVALAASACGSSSSSSSSSAPAGGGTGPACNPASNKTVAANSLTIGTDNPAYDPYFTGPAGGEWKGQYNHDPTTGKGFEDAVAYAVADQMGYSPDQVKWIALNWKQSFTPGPKNFDFYLAQVSINPKREQNADFSQPYYSSTQAIVAKPGSPITQATSLADLKSYQLGTESGTTSYDDIQQVIAPSKQPKVYDSTNDATQALSNGQIDGLVVDFPSAYYIANVEPGGLKIVGQFSGGSGAEQWGLVLAKDNPLTACVNQAMDALKTSGKLQAIEEQWLAHLAHAPMLQ